MSSTFEKICEIIGEPKNYGPTPDEQAEIERQAQEELVGESCTYQHFCHILIYSDEKRGPRKRDQGTA